MDRFKTYIKEVVSQEKGDYYRIDHGHAPKTFSGSQSHGHDDDAII